MTCLVHPRWEHYGLLQEAYIGYIAECVERDVRGFSDSATDDDGFSDESLEWYKGRGLTDRQVQALQVLAEELLETKRVVCQYDLAMSGDTGLEEGLQAVADFVARRRSLAEHVPVSTSR